MYEKLPVQWSRQLLKYSGHFSHFFKVVALAVYVCPLWLARKNWSRVLYVVVATLRKHVPVYYDMGDV